MADGRTGIPQDERSVSASARATEATADRTSRDVGRTEIPTSPDARPSGGGHRIPLCSATAPDLFTIGCQLPEGHDGLHRNNQVLWQWPQVVTVGGDIPDLDIETDHWQNRQVRFSSHEPPL